MQPRRIPVVSLTGVAIIVASVVLISLVSPSTGNHTSRDNKKLAKSKGIEKVVNYLGEYGYLSHEQVEEGAEAHLEESLRLFQRHSGLKETGQVDAATMKSMRLYRCGNADMMETERHEVVGIPLVGWEKKSLTYRIENVSESLRDLETIRNDIRAAFGYWMDEADFQITEVLDKNVEVDIKISFEIGPHDDNHTFTPESLALAHAFYPNHEGGDLKGDIHFNDFYRWGSGPHQTNHYDFLKVATHEIGHALGLTHSEEIDSIMFFVVTGHHDTEFELHAEDKRNIKTLYGTRSLSNNENDLGASGSDIILNYGNYGNEIQPRMPSSAFSSQSQSQLEIVDPTQSSGSGYTEGNFNYNYAFQTVCYHQLQLWPFQCNGYWGYHCCRRYLQQSVFYQQQDRFPGALFPQSPQRPSPIPIPTTEKVATVTATEKEFLFLTTLA